MNKTDMDRSKALLKIKSGLSRKYEGNDKAAEAEMDKKLGPMWRDMVEEGDAKACFYKRVKGMLDDLGYVGEEMPDEIPMEESSKKLKSEPKPELKKKPGIVERVRLLIVGK